MSTVCNLFNTATHIIGLHQYERVCLHDILSLTIYSIRLLYISCQKKNIGQKDIIDLTTPYTVFPMVVQRPFNKRCLSIIKSCNLLPYFML